jgi:hypothetical protein
MYANSIAVSANSTSLGNLKGSIGYIAQSNKDSRILHYHIGTYIWSTTHSFCLLLVPYTSSFFSLFKFNLNAEYGMGAQIPTMGDVYSYGVLLLEMFTGKCSTDEKFKDGMNLHKHVAAHCPHGVAEILDRAILQNDLDGGNPEMIQNCILPMVKLGLMCSMASSRDRLGMEQVSAAILHVKRTFLELCSRRNGLVN